MAGIMQAGQLVGSLREDERQGNSFTKCDGALLARPHAAEIAGVRSTRTALTPVSHFLLRLVQRLPFANGPRRGGPIRSLLHCLLLPLLPTLLTRELKKLRVTTIFKRHKTTTRVEGRSYPLLYRAHKWAKGGWTYLRPSPFGIYVGLPNRDLHRPKRENKHKP